MARNGSGVYSLPAGSTAADGESADASDINVPFQDLEADANVARPIVAGGTGATSAAGARTNLGVAGTTANETVTGNWDIVGNWTFTGDPTINGTLTVTAADTDEQLRVYDSAYGPGDWPSFSDGDASAIFAKSGNSTHYLYMNSENGAEQGILWGDSLEANLGSIAFVGTDGNTDTDSNQMRLELDGDAGITLIKSTSAAGNTESRIGINTYSVSSNVNLDMSSCQDGLALPRFLGSVPTNATPDGTLIFANSADDLYLRTAATWTRMLKEGDAGLGDFETAVATTSGQSVSISTSIPSGAKQIEILLRDISLDGGTDDVVVQVGPAGGIVTSGYNSVAYRGSVERTDTSGFVMVTSSSSREIIGKMVLDHAGSNVWISSHACSFSHGGGDVALAGELTRISIAVNGTPTDSFDAGSVQIRVTS